MKQMIKEIDGEIESLMTQDLDALENQVRWVVCGSNENQNKPGIHSLNPDSESIAQAYEHAISRGFDTVYLHFDNVRQLKRGVI